MYVINIYSYTVLFPRSLTCWSSRVVHHVYHIAKMYWVEGARGQGEALV